MSSIPTGSKFIFNDILSTKTVTEQQHLSFPQIEVFIINTNLSMLALKVPTVVKKWGPTCNNPSSHDSLNLAKFTQEKKPCDVTHHN